MEPSQIGQLLALLKSGNQLKRTDRTGWDMRGVPDAENVAAHSYGVAYGCLILAPYVGVPIDLERTLSLAILHDLPEALTTDIPSPVWKRLPAGSKPVVERQAMLDIFAGTELEADMLSLWEEVKAKSTPESKLVADVDKLDMYLQCRMYEQQFGNLLLEEFWSERHIFSYETVQSLYDQLVLERSAR